MVDPMVWLKSHLSEQRF